MAHPNDTIAVTDGETTENCEVITTWSHYGNKVAKVEGDELAGFVEVS